MQSVEIPSRANDDPHQGAPYDEDDFGEANSADSNVDDSASTEGDEFGIPVQKDPRSGSQAGEG